MIKNNPQKSIIVILIILKLNSIPRMILLLKKDWIIVIVIKREKIKMMIIEFQESRLILIFQVLTMKPCWIRLFKKMIAVKVRLLLRVKLKNLVFLGLRNRNLKVNTEGW